MRGRVQQSRGELVGGWLVALAATAVYALTADRSVSWWDCGEFIAVSHMLGVGHPPGAPLYQLLLHLCCLLAPQPQHIALCCNLFSALCAGLTAMVLFRTVLELQPPQPATARGSWLRLVPAATGALCYAWCHTAWFSAVESEVYAMAMLMASLMVWVALRWRRLGNPRRLLLVALLTGLGVCVHLLTLLALPAVALIWTGAHAAHRGRRWRLPPHAAPKAAAALLMLCLGLAPYLAVPLMARANPPINQLGQPTAEAMARYLRRQQYEHPPLYPRMWRQREADRANEAQWSGGGNGLWANVRYGLTYQLGYMYGRYVLDNYFGRRRDDDTLRLYILPLLLAVAGLVAGRRGRGWRPSVAGMLFIMGGPLLNIYLNHPCYEPRERDYAYVLSFYAIGIWVGLGCAWAAQWLQSHRKGGATALLMAVPLLMAAANWQDHDRHNRHAVHDIAWNHLHSCDEGALLFTFGDNDTFPLWALHYAEGVRPDMQLHNINLMGYRAFADTLRSNAYRRPVYLTPYAYDRLKHLFAGRLQLEGYCWRLMPTPCPQVNHEAFARHMAHGMVWHDYSREWLEPVTRSMLDIYSGNLQLYGQ